MSSENVDRGNNEGQNLKDRAYTDSQDATNKSVSEIDVFEARAGIDSGSLAVGSEYTVLQNTHLAKNDKVDLNWSADKDGSGNFTPLNADFSIVDSASSEVQNGVEPSNGFFKTIGNFFNRLFETPSEQAQGSESGNTTQLFNLPFNQAPTSPDIETLDLTRSEQGPVEAGEDLIFVSKVVNSTEENPSDSDTPSDPTPGGAEGDPANSAPEVGDVDLGGTLEDNAFTFSESDLLAASSDLDGDLLSVTDISVDPTFGSLEDNGDGTWTFTPTLNYNGEDVPFSFTVSDGEASQSAVALLDVSPVNDAPIDIVLSNNEVAENSIGGTVVADLTAIDPDIGDSHTFEIVGQTQTVAQKIISAPGIETWGREYNGSDGGKKGTGLRLVSEGRTYDDDGLATQSVWRVRNANDTDQDVEISFAGSAEVITLTVPANTEIFVAADSIKTAKLFFDGEQIDVKAPGSQDFSAGTGSTVIDGSHPLFEVVGSELRVKDGADIDFESAASHDVTLLVTDAAGASYQETVQINVTDIFENTAPEAGDVDLGATAEDNAVTFSEADLLANTTDVDGDSVSVVDVSVDPSYGTISDNGDGTWTFTPKQDYNGDDVPLSFTVSDGNLSDTATAVLNVTAVNDAPDAGDIDLGTIAEDSAIVISESDLLANSSDPEGDSLSVTDLSVDSSYGALVDNGDGTWTFSPASDYSGDDVPFTFTISDGEKSDTATASLDVNASADAPVLSAAVSSNGMFIDFEDVDLGGRSWKQVNEDNVGWQTDNSNDELEVGIERVYGGSDRENQILELEADRGDASNFYTDIATQDGGTYSFSFDLSARRGHGGSGSEVEVLWNGEVIDTITPGNNFGWVTHEYELVGDGGTARLELKATDQNSLGGLIDNVGFEQVGFAPEHPVGLNISAGLQDNDGSETLSLVAEGFPEGAVLSDGVNVFTATAETGNVDITDWNLDSLTVAAPGGYEGEMDISFTSTATETSNGDASSVTKTVSVNITQPPENEAPVAGDVDLGSTVEDTAIVFSEADLLANSADADGDTLSVTDVSVDAAYGEVTDNGDGTWTFTPAEDFSGNDLPISFVVSDGEESDSATASIDVSSNPDAASLSVSVTPTEGGGVAGQAINGGNGSELLEGGQGDDTIDGGKGNDTIHGDSGSGYQTYDLVIDASLNDVDGSESLSLVVSGLPEGAALSAGTDLGDGSWQLSAEDIAGLQMDVPADAPAFDLTVSATATEGDTGASQVVTDVTNIAPASPAGGDDLLSGGKGNDEIHGGAGADTLEGDQGNDTLYGGEGADSLYGGSGNDEMHGGAGDDKFFAHGGREVGTVDGGEGYDQLVGTDGNDTFVMEDNMANLNSVEEIDGGTGSNKIEGTNAGETLDFTGITLTNIEKINAGKGDDTVTGTDATDVIEGNKGDDVIYGAEGDDTLKGDQGNDTLYGGEGADSLYGGSGNDELHGGAGDDKFFAHGGREVGTVNGGEGYDQLIGTDKNDTFVMEHNMANLNSVEEIDGGAGTNKIEGTNAGETLDFTGITLTNIEKINAGKGDDTVTGTDAADVIEGNKGDDELHGAGGDDQLYGDQGNDTIYGGEGDDSIYGGSGNDELHGGAGDDTFFAHGGKEIGTVDGGDGYDKLAGGDKNDTFVMDDNLGNLNSVEEIDGGAGYNQIQGGNDGETLDFSDITLTNIDKIDAGKGDDTVFGSDGDDYIRGNKGDDQLSGGAGDDTLQGDQGHDTFIMMEGGGSDEITGGNGGGWTDAIQLTNADGSGSPEGGWTLIVEGEEVDVDMAEGFLDIGADRQGSITFDDGTEVAFDGIERIEW